MEEEINLVDYIKAIYRQRVFILVIILVFLFAGLILYFSKEAKRYSGKGILEVGNMEVCQRGICNKFIPEPISVLKSKIENRAYDSEIKKEDIKGVEGVEVILPEDQKDLEKVRILTIKVKTTNQKTGKNYLENLLNAIVTSHNKKFQKKENYLKDLINTETAKIKAIEKDKNLLSLQYLYSEHLSNINDAKLSLANIERTKIIEISDKFNLEKKNFIIYFVTSLFLGIFVSIFLAFLRDFWQRNKKEIIEG